ncbi:MAG: DUF1992 domain-containing protein [Gammaproteobacteria bacterium]|nr:MAG: DUF1992 domain-containing protein [Gammaproteobacteria bacterium]
MWLVDRLAEARIREAAERGELQGLEGEGRPLPEEAVETPALVPEALRPGYRLLKSAGFIPPELEPHRELKEVEELLALARDGAEEARLGARLRLLQERVARERGRRLELEAAYLERVRRRLGGPG